MTVANNGMSPFVNYAFIVFIAALGLDLFRIDEMTAHSGLGL